MGNTVATESRDDGHDSTIVSANSTSSCVTPSRGNVTLHRRGSSFLEEPVTLKSTERGEAPITVLPSNGDCAKSNVLRFAVSEMQGWRSHMEDKHNLCPPLDVDSKEKLHDHYLFAVFDGHGGNFTSHFAGENLVRTLTSQSEWKAYLRLPKAKIRSTANHENDENGTSRGDVAGLKLLKAALTATFLDLDSKLMEAQRNRRLNQLNELESVMSSLGTVVEQEVFQSGSEDNMMVQTFAKTPPASLPNNVQLERSGSTGVVVLVTPTHIICANAGDSRAVLTRAGLALPLSFDHKPNNDLETARVERAGGFIRAGRVDGDLAVSRSFGDFAYKSHSYAGAKDQRVTVYPDILIHPRDYSNDEYIVLACDGVWDRLTNRDCASLVRTLIDEGESDPGLVCEEIIDTCLELDSRDNMTCAVVIFPGAKMHSKAPSSNSPDSVGVLKRRAEREREWGKDSTPAKRAHKRLEDRRKKQKELLRQKPEDKTPGVSGTNKIGAPANSLAQKTPRKNPANTLAIKSSRKAIRIHISEVARQ